MPEPPKRLKIWVSTNMEFTVIIHLADEGGYWTEVPALPGCGSQGETVDEAISMTKDAIEGFISYLKDKGKEIPVEKDILVKVAVAV